MVSANVKRRRAMLGKRNPRWKTGKALMSNKRYVTVPAPRKGKGGKREYLHRKVTGAQKNEAVHHRDERKRNNAPRNLRATRKHPGARNRG